jgi:hypothetical protein
MYLCTYSSSISAHTRWNITTAGIHIRFLSFWVQYILPSPMISLHNSVAFPFSVGYSLTDYFPFVLDFTFMVTWNRQSKAVDFGKTLSTTFISARFQTVTTTWGWSWHFMRLRQFSKVHTKLSSSSHVINANGPIENVFSVEVILTNSSKWILYLFVLYVESITLTMEKRLINLIDSRWAKNIIYSLVVAK